MNIAKLPELLWRIGIAIDIHRVGETIAAWSPSPIRSYGPSGQPPPYSAFGRLLKCLFFCGEAVAMEGRGFPSPWIVEDNNDPCFIVSDANGQKLAYVYFDDQQRSCSPRLRREESL